MFTCYKQYSFGLHSVFINQKSPFCGKPKRTFSTYSTLNFFHPVSKEVANKPSKVAI